MEQKDYYTCEDMRRFFNSEEGRKYGNWIGGALPDNNQTYAKTQRMNFGAVAASGNIPKFIDMFGWCSGQIDQGLYGICYMCACMHLAETITWRCMGRKIQFTFAEALDCACDTYNMSYKKRKENKGKPKKLAYGGHFSISYIYNYNSNLSQHYFTDQVFSNNADLFKKAIDKVGASVTMLPIGKSKSNIKIALSRHGCLYHSFNCAAWGRDGNHAILATGYNSTGVFCLNSWGPNSRYKTHFTWDEISRYSNEFNGLNISFKNLG